MTTTPRMFVAPVLALVLAAGLALGPTTSALAQQGRVPDHAGDASRATDVTRLQVKHAQHRITGVLRIPRLKPGQLSGTELLIKTRGTKKVYAVGVMRDRRGKVVDTSLTWRALNDPIEPTKLACTRITTSLTAERTVVSVPKSCLSRTGPNRKVKAKARTVNGTIGLQGAYFDDQTKFTPYLERGAGQASTSGPQGRVTARGGLIVRSLPTTSSARTGKLRAGTVYPLSCRVTGSVVYRNNDQDADLSNLWYRLPGAPREWVSALYVKNVHGAPPFCGDGASYRGRVTTALLTPREAPTTRANAHGGFSRGRTVEINCKLRGQRVDGNNLWYNLPHGLWVSARYVSNIGAAPGYCTG